MSETPATTWRARTEQLVTQPGRVYLVEASSDQHDQPIATAAVRLAEGIDPTRAAYLLRKVLEELAGDATLSVVAIPAAAEETDWSHCGVSESSDDFEDDHDHDDRTTAATACPATTAPVNSSTTTASPCSPPPHEST
jgi:hypothetical protein